jgi:phosphate transport system protein
VAKLGNLVADRLATVVDAYRRRDAAAAVDIWSTDIEVDELHDKVFQDVAAVMAGDPAKVGVCTHLLFITKNLERIGDHATNIAELANYEITGQRLADRPKG